MRYLSVTLVGLAVLLAPAGTVRASSMTKTVIRIDAKGAPSGGNPTGGTGSFTLHASGLADKGGDSYAFSGSKGTFSLLGKKGDLFLQLKRRPSGLNVDSEGLDLWTGTWAIAKGSTGSYAGLNGQGAFVAVIGPSYKVAFHLEGFLQT